VRGADVVVSALTGAGMADLRARIAQEVRRLADDAGPPALTRTRHRAGLADATVWLDRAAEEKLAELRGEALRAALRGIGRVTGRVGTEDVLDAVSASSASASSGTPKDGPGLCCAEQERDDDGTVDVVVIGGGMPAAKPPRRPPGWGARTLLLTQRRDTIGEMSCNPAIGGIGKGHLVREIDAFDGLMGRAADRAGIHFKLLNRSKGPAVRGPRAQADRARYRRAIQDLLAEQAGLQVHEATVDDFLIAPDGSLAGVACVDGRRILLRRGGADHRDIPARHDPCRARQHAGRSCRRSAGGRARGKRWRGWSCRSGG